MGNWRICRQASDAAKFNIEYRAAAANSYWSAKWECTTFAAAEKTFQQVVAEDKRMEQLNSGAALSSREQQLEKQVADMTAELESLRKVMNE